MAAPLTNLDWMSLMQAHPELAARPLALRRYAIHIAAATGKTVLRTGARPRPQDDTRRMVATLLPDRKFRIFKPAKL